MPVDNAEEFRRLYLNEMKNDEKMHLIRQKEMYDYKYKEKYESDHERLMRMQKDMDWMYQRKKEIEETNARIDDFLDWAIKGAKLVEIGNGPELVQTATNWCKANAKGEYMIDRRDGKTVIGAFMNPEDAVKFKLFYG